MINVSNVFKEYSDGESRFYALNGIDFSAYEGEMTAIIGASGAGKSTLLHIIACIDKYDSGQVTVDDIELNSLSERAAAEYRNTKVGIVLQSFALISDFNVFENIVLPLRLSKGYVKREEMKKRAESVAEQVGIDSLLRKKISELSGGEKQRVAIARALVNSPKYILADEPTGALDSTNTKNIVKIFKEISRSGVGVIIVTHDKEVSDQCDKILEIKDGRILKSPYNN